MKTFDQAIQGSRTLVFCRSKDTEGADSFVSASFDKLRKLLGEQAAVPFLAFCSLSPDSFSADEGSFIKAGFVTDTAIEHLPDGVFTDTLPQTRVLTLTTDEPVESRSAVHLELCLYARVFNLKLINAVYEYHFRTVPPAIVYAVEIKE